MLNSAAGRGRVHRFSSASLQSGAIVIAAALAIACVAGTAWGNNWNVSSGNWSTAANWLGGEPTSGVSATIGNSGTATIDQAGEACSTLYLDVGAVSMIAGGLNVSSSAFIGAVTGTFSQTGGAVAISSDLRLASNSSSSIGTYYLSGSGQLSASNEYVGDLGTGTFSHTNGINRVSSTLTVGGGSGAKGTYSLSGGGQVYAANETIGESGTGTFTHTDGINRITSTLTLGKNLNAKGAYSLGGGGQVSAATEYVGNYGVGTFTHNSGSNTVTGALYIAYYSNATASTYTLAGTGDLSASATYVGYYGTGVFNQTGGTHTLSAGVGGGVLYVGYMSGVGTYNLSGTGSLSAVDERIGCTAGSTFNQSGGTNKVSGTLYVDPGPGPGTYNQTGGQLTAANEWVGDMSTGVFNQSDGVHTVTTALYLAKSSSSSKGTFNLSGTGQLTAYNEYVGYAGTGAFSQTGGTHVVNSKLYLGYTSASSAGTYNLSGTGVLRVDPGGEMRVGADGGTGRFEWFGGSLTTPTLTMGSKGTLALGFDCDVAALVSGSLFHGSKLNGLSSATLEVTNGATVAHGAATATLSTLRVGSATGEGTYTLTSAGTLTLSGVGDLRVGADTGVGRFEWFGGNNLTANKITLAGPDSVNKATLAMGFDFYMAALQSGSLYKGSSIYGLDKATLEITGGATATQSQNSATMGSLRIGSDEGAGTYRLGGVSGKEPPGLTIPGGPTGAEVRVGTDSVVGRLEWFSQSLHTPSFILGSKGVLAMGFDFSLESLLSGSLYGGSSLVGLSSATLEVTNGASATYSGGGRPDTIGTLRIGSSTGSGGLAVEGGTLNVPTLSVGYAGAGALTQDGGTNNIITASLNLGENLGGTGTYYLQDVSMLNSRDVFVGKWGIGRFYQSDDGRHTLTGALYLGYAAGAGGTYTLSDYGKLYATTVYVGYFGAGTFSQTGGTHDADPSLPPWTSRAVYLGYAPDARGTYYLSGKGSFYADVEYVGYMGTGTFNQTGGTNNVSPGGILGGAVPGGGAGSGGPSSSGNALILGYDFGSQGTYNLGGQGALDSQGSPEIIGLMGTGTFNQTGGENRAGDLCLGYDFAAQGNYNLSGTGLLKASTEYVGYVGTGTFKQTGGENTSSDLYLGCFAGAQGAYNLSGGALNASREYLGWNNYPPDVGLGTFDQSGGGNTVSELRIGSGTYTLRGTGMLAANYLTLERPEVGNTVAFIQSGGTAAIDYLWVNDGSWYDLSGTGELSTTQEGIGGTFHQSGGTHTATYLSVDGGKYEFPGGTLQINGGLNVEGTLDFGGGPAVLNASNALINFGRPGGSVLGSSAAALHIGDNSLLIVPAGMDPGKAFADYSNTGMLHTAGTTLTVGPGEGFAGWGHIDDHVDCQGTITATSGGFIFLWNGLMVSGTGAVDLGYGDLYVNDTSSGISGGSLKAGGISVGTANPGIGAFAQSGGTSSLASLYLGDVAGATGSYALSDSGELSAANEYVGHSGIGVFTQSGGKNTISTALYVGYYSGAAGTYELSGTGQLSAPTEYVGYAGSGTRTFTQTGGTNTLTGALYLGYNSGATGSYALSDSGELSAADDYVGYYGTGTLNTQNGGRASSTNGYLGYYSGSNGTATVDGSGSKWTNTKDLVVGRSGTGTLNIKNGGQVSNTDGYLGYSSGSKGTATVDGTGSVWNNTGSLYVGGNDSAAGGTGSVTVQNGGQLTVGGTLKVWNSGSLTIQSGGGVTAGSLSKASAGTITWTSGTLGITGAGGLSIGSAGPLGSSVTLGAGKTLNVTKTATVDKDATLVVGGGGLVAGTLSNSGTFNWNGGTAQLAAVELNGTSLSTLSAGHDKTLVTQALTMAESAPGVPTATLDLGDNCIVIDYSGDPASSPLEQVKAWIKAGWLNPDAPWYGPGITSTAARDNPGLYTVGFVDQGRLLAETGELWYGPGGTRGETFGGIAVDSTSILVKLTYLGDVDLDGMVYDDDVAIMSGNYSPTGPTGAEYWGGDIFGFDGWVYDDEAAIIGGAYNNGRLYGDPLGGLAGLTAAPEPATLALLAAGLAALARRRYS